MRTFVSRFAGSKLLERFPPVQGISFSIRSFVSDATSGGKPEFNILFFCPRNDDHFQKFEGEYLDLIRYIDPKSVSISDIAHNPQNSVKAIRSLLGSNIPPETIIPHLVLIGHTKEEVDEKIRLFRNYGINSVIAIRGNPATVKKDLSYMRHPDGYEDMPQLMSRIKELHPEMKIVVAGYPNKHPYAKSFDKDMDELKRKVDHGADMIVTQHFFDNNVFLGFMEECAKRNITLPIIPSVLPIGNPKYLFSFSGAAKIDIPAKVTQILFEKAGITVDGETIENESVRRKAVEYTADQIRKLIDLKLPNIDRINTYVANDALFLKEVLDEVGATKPLTKSKDSPVRS